MVREGRLSLREIAGFVGVAHGTVSKWAAAAGVPCDGQRRRTRAKLAQALKLVEQGASATAAARKLRMSPNVVLAHLDESGSGYTRGHGRYARRFDHAAILELARTMPYRRVARTLGCTPSLVSLVCRRATVCAQKPVDNVSPPIHTRSSGAASRPTG